MTVGLSLPKKKGASGLPPTPEYSTRCWTLPRIWNLKKNKSKQKKYRHSAEIDEDAQTKITNKEKDIGWNPNKL